MGANDSDIPVALMQCKYLWEEYKYRHDLIWQRILRFTTAVTLISIIPYVQQDITRLLKPWILLAPLLATTLAGFVLVVMREELKVFDKIKKAYRRQQNKLLDGDLKHNLDEKSRFEFWVLLYLICLVMLSVANGLIAWRIWIPKVVNFR